MRTSYRHILADPSVLLPKAIKGALVAQQLKCWPADIRLAVLSLSPV